MAAKPRRAAGKGRTRTPTTGAPRGPAAAATGARTAAGRAPAAAAIAGGGAAEAAAEAHHLSRMVADLAVLAAANNLMAQTAFLSLERMRLSSEMADERVTPEFAARVWERCEKLTQASDDLILQVLDRAAPGDPRGGVVRDLVQLRRELAARGTPGGAEQPRLLESLERMYR